MTAWDIWQVTKSEKNRRLLVERIESRLNELNGHGSRYDIDLSYGCEFIEGPRREPSEIIALTDDRIYKDKARRKAARQG